MALYSTIYNSIFKRNSTFVASIFAGAFLFQVGLDEVVTRWYTARNQGKLWADLKPKVLAGFENAEEDDE
ncbi:qcr9 subunit 9 of the ubiquinol cytochrome-c reductase complex [Pichia californica]|uniref:Complex III subunit 9 n=1 Tax=Pichia californica TaxID=460514 RepID=A0A9P7BEN2_9ASCO|nr:qcr9 subunit 9 of the ubiquinol cytochrome-c reductase complex [[Candida] californica]KAG0688051.1 qcr9 subunit 9 of the ubiquinol cytochrome-c reductase complex [[Candida] californica]